MTNPIDPTVAGRLLTAVESMAHRMSDAGRDCMAEAILSGTGSPEYLAASRRRNRRDVAMRRLVNALQRHLYGV